MKIRFSPQMLIEMMRSDNPPELTLGKLYKVIDEVDELIIIKDDKYKKLAIPYDEEGVLFEYVKEDEDD